MVLQKLLWSKISQRLMRADSIIHILPLQQSLIQFRHAVGIVVIERFESSGGFLIHVCVTHLSQLDHVIMTGMFFSSSGYPGVLSNLDKR